MENEFLDLNELLRAVEELKSHWVGQYLAKAYVSCYRGKKSPINLRLFNQLDMNNRRLFVLILNMRSDPLWSDEELYQTEIKLKKTVGIK